LHIELLDDNEEPIATFAVPDGFADALRQAEATAKESQRRRCNETLHNRPIHGYITEEDPRQCL
jgi:hypothetical protein